MTTRWLPAPPRWRLRDVARADLAVMGYAVVWLALFGASRAWPALTLVVTWSYFGIGIATAWAFFRAASDPAVPERMRNACRPLGYAAVTVIIGGVLWTSIKLQAAGTAPPWWSSLADQLYAPFTLAAVWAVSRDETVRWRERDVALDALTLGVGLAALAWYFSIRPLTQQDFLVWSWVDAVLSWGVSAALAWAYLRTTATSARAALALLLAAQVAGVVSAYVVTPHETSYRVGDPVDLVYFAAWVCRFGAARLLWYAAHRPSAPAASARYRSGLAPRVLLVGAFALLLYMVFFDAGGRMGGALGIAGVVSLMTALLVARNALELARTAQQAAAVAGQKDLFHAVLDNVTDFVFVIDDAGTVVWASDAAWRAFGVLSGASLVSFVHDADVGELHQWLPDDGRPLSDQSISVRLRRPDGQWASVDVRGRDLRDDALVRGIVLNAHDRTSELALEARVRHVEKLALLHDMAGRIAHAFNNSLMVVQGHAELLAADATLSAAQQQDVADMRSAAERGAAIARQLLGFAGRQASTPRAVDVAGVVDEAMPGWSRLLNSGMSIRREGDAGAWRAIVDRAQLEQVLLNLVVNARDAMPHGGTIIVRVASCALAGGGSGVSVSVADTGVGMTAEQQSRVFEPFYTTKAPGFGTGLGLAMVATIVRGAGGDVRVESALGAGATFTITLPAQHARASGSVRMLELPDEEAAAATAHVVLVDDDDAVRNVSRRILVRAGFEVSAFDGGAAALAYLAQATNPVDVVITDMMMPHMSGRELIEVLAAKYPHIPVIVITGFSAPTDTRDPLPPQVHRILSKPFETRDLVGAVRSATGPE